MLTVKMHLNSTGKQAQNLVIAGIAREAVAGQTTKEILTAARTRPKTVLEAAMLTTIMLWTEMRRVLQACGRNSQVGVSAALNQSPSRKKAIKKAAGRKDPFGGDL
jgi:formaldehyde-activating enzyme involved in methanogenesis